LARELDQSARSQDARGEAARNQNARLTATLMLLGYLECAVGNFVEARSLFHEALVLTREIGNVLAESTALDSLGFVAYHLGDYPLARKYYVEALGPLRDHGDKHTLALTLIHFGLLLHDEGSNQDALALYQEALFHLRELGDRLLIAQCLEAIAGVLLVTAPPAGADAAMAARLYGTASALREALHSPHSPSELPRYERNIASAREQLHKAAWEVAWAEGRAMSMEGAVDYALGCGAEKM
jgi:tetratricopeptide (TPR) repeat protein